jgi:hypothetical protein
MNRFFVTSEPASSEIWLEENPKYDAMAFHMTQYLHARAKGTSNVESPDVLSLSNLASPECEINTIAKKNQGDFKRDWTEAALLVPEGQSESTWGGFSHRFPYFYLFSYLCHLFARASSVSTRVQPCCIPSMLSLPGPFIPSAIHRPSPYWPTSRQRKTLPMPCFSAAGTCETSCTLFSATNLVF